MAKMNRRKIIVFGATGEIGGRVARLAVDAGHAVYGVSRGRNSRETVDLSGVKMLSGDKSDRGFLAHLAWRWGMLRFRHYPGPTQTRFYE